METQHTVRDALSAIARVGGMILPRLVGAYYGCRMGWFRGAVWGWRHLCIHPSSVFLVEPGAKLEVQGRLYVGFSLKPDVPLPGNRRTGLVIKKNGTFRAGEDVRLALGSTVHVSAGAEIEIGDRSFVSYDSAIIARKKISIGSDCAISWGVCILDSYLHKIEGTPYAVPVHIGSRVWIGHNASVLQGVTIGNSAIIGAHSLVNRDVLPHAVAVGLPARMIKEHAVWEL